MTLGITAVRGDGATDRLVVSHSGGRVESVVLGRGGGLPDPLVHWVVESVYGLRDGYWGQLQAGVDPAALQRELSRVAGHPTGGLAQATCLVTCHREDLDGAADPPAAFLERLTRHCRAQGVPVPSRARPDLVVTARQELARWTERWHRLEPGESWQLEYPVGGR